MYTSRKSDTQVQVCTLKYRSYGTFSNLALTTYSVEIYVIVERTGKVIIHVIIPWGGGEQAALLFQYFTEVLKTEFLIISKLISTQSRMLEYHNTDI